MSEFIVICASLYVAVYVISYFTWMLDLVSLADESYVFYLTVLLIVSLMFIIFHYIEFAVSPALAQLITFFDCVYICFYSVTAIFFIAYNSVKLNLYIKYKKKLK